MSRVILATGSFAQQPYLIKKIERNVYSVEELCYSLVQSAQFLDAQIMDPELVWWIGAECSLPGLAPLEPFGEDDSALFFHLQGVDGEPARPVPQD